MLLEFVYRLRGIERWPVATATVNVVTSGGGRGGGFKTIYFTYMPPSGAQTGRLTADSQSSLFNICEGDTFDIQFNSQIPSRFYCREAQGFEVEVRLWLSLAIFVFIIYQLASKFLP